MFAAAAAVAAVAVDLCFRSVIFLFVFVAFSSEAKIAHRGWLVLVLPFFWLDCTQGGTSCSLCSVMIVLVTVLLFKYLM